MLFRSAIAARQNFERKPFLRLIPAAQQAVGDRHLAEIDDWSQLGRMAEAAMIGHGAGLAAFCNMAAASEASRVM